MKNFFEQFQCKNESCCVSCRKSRKFRISVFDVFDDINSIDFDCPKGKKIVWPKLPSLLKQFKSLTKCSGRLAKAVINGKKIIASSEEVNRRLKICERCDKYVMTDIGYRCAVCGCFTKNKDKLNPEHCPIGKW